MKAAAATRQPNPLLVRLGRLLEVVLNRALALDAQTQERLDSLNGQRIGIELRSFDVAVAVSVNEGRLCVGPYWAGERNLNLRAAPGSLLAMALRRGSDSFLPPGKVDISGDAELARQVEKLVRDFKPDFEEAFAQTFGDVVGVPIARALHRGLAWSRASVDAMVRDSAEYLREESRDLIAPAEMEQFLDEVDDLRERTDRLDARVQRLAARRKESAS